MVAVSVWADTVWSLLPGRHRPTLAVPPWVDFFFARPARIGTLLRHALHPTNRPPPCLNPPPSPRQYGEFRRGYYGDAADTRLVVWGLRYILEHYVARRWTREVGPALQATCGVAWVVSDAAPCVCRPSVDVSPRPAGWSAGWLESPLACPLPRPLVALVDDVQAWYGPACRLQEVELADRFYAGHRAPSAAPFPYPRDLFLKFIEENDGGLAFCCN